MIFNELNTGFRWYDALEKQTRFKEYCAQLCDFSLISPCNDLLPFQIKTEDFGIPTSWNLVYLDGTITTQETLANLSIEVVAGGDSYEISIDGYGTVAFSLLLGTIDLTIQNLVDDINASGFFFTAIKLGNFILITAPTGSGAAFNGTALTYTVTTGPFAGEADYQFSGGLDASSSGDTLNINSCIPYLNRYEIEGFNYLQYNGLDLPGCMSQQMPCGKWYSEISDGDNTVYSEVFEVVPITDISFVQSELPLFTAWRWYDAKDKQTRYKEYCDNLCDFYLLSGNDKLLPFQIRVPDGVGVIQSWTLVGIDEDCEFILDISLLSVVTTSDGDRITYNGDDIDLPCGKFYSVINDGNNIWYSEVINITDAISDMEAETSYLLQENGFKILQEDAFGILLP